MHALSCRVPIVECYIYVCVSQGMSTYASQQCVCMYLCTHTEQRQDFGESGPTIFCGRFFLYIFRWSSFPLQCGGFVHNEGMGKGFANVSVAFFFVVYIGNALEGLWVTNLAPRSYFFFCLWSSNFLKIPLFLNEGQGNSEKFPRKNHDRPG